MRFRIAVMVLSTLSVIVGQCAIASDLHKELIDACRKGDQAAVERSVERGADVNQSSTYGSLPVILAVSRGDLELADLLIRLGASVDPYQENPLLFAAREGHLKIIALLLDQGAPIDKIDRSSKRTALWHA